MANPNWIDKWSPDDLKQLVYKREVERKSFAAIAVEMGQNEGSCGRRYREILALREMQAEQGPSEPPITAATSVHKSLGIETYVHMQAVLTEPGGIWGNKRSQSFAHWYRYPVTLPKVLHEAS